MSLHLKLLCATVFWGATPTIGRLLAEYHAPFVIVFGRFAVSTVVLLWLLLAARQAVRIPLSVWPRFLWLGAMGIAAHNGLMFKGLEYTTATVASIILGLIALQVVLLDWVFYGRRVDRWTAAGVVLGFLGTAVVITDGQLSRLGDIGLGPGEVLIFLSALAWAVYSVAGRSALQTYSPLLVTTAASGAGLLIVTPFVFEQPDVTIALFTDARALCLIFFLGLVGSGLGFLWYYQAVVAIGTVGAALYINLVPVFGVLIAALVLGETVGASVVTGGLLVVAALMLVNRPRRTAGRVVLPERS